MPRPDDITGRGQEFFPAPSLTWLNDAVGSGFVRGGVYLLAGEPGIGKTTLALQILGDLAKTGMKVLYVTSEQGLADIKRTLQRIYSTNNSSPPEAFQRIFSWTMASET